MKRMILLLLLGSIYCQADEAAVVHHPAPKEPIYVSAAWYETLKKSLPPLPMEESPAQKNDEKTLRELQAGRTEADCQAARTEMMVTLGNFYGQPQGPLTPAQVEKLAPFFEQVRNDADFFIQKLKKEFPRKRPFLYMADIQPCVAREVTGAYPSGHAMLSQLFALILVDLKLGDATRLGERAREIGKHRVVSGMHHRPTLRRAGSWRAYFLNS